MRKIHRLLLGVVSSALFGRKMPTVEVQYIVPVLKESVAQAVFPLVFSALETTISENLSEEQYEKLSRKFYKHTVAGTLNFEEHGEVDELMKAAGLPYVILKGLSSAMYYPEPILRNMGDVDFLVRPKDMAKVGKILTENGFSQKENDGDGIHIAYFRPPMSTWELHRSINGVPDSLIGKRIRADLSRAIDSAERKEIDGITCMVPDRYHHGLILLLHTASHLTGEGVGLRHLCDFVVFAASFDDAGFRTMFEKKLKSYGLWQFARSLYLLGEIYLKAPKRSWAEISTDGKGIRAAHLEGLMNDILSGGNFGTKDMNRYRQIKYISDRGERTVGGGGIFRQGLKTLNGRVYGDYKAINRHKVLLPLGYIAEGGRYVGLLLSRKRKTADTAKMLKEAKIRKQIYSKLDLFKS